MATHQPDSVSVDYEEWLKSHAAGRKELLRQKKTVFKEKPLISIVIPLYNTPKEYLKELIDSVRAQTYTNWQLCLADGSEGSETRAFLNKKYRKENRITYKKLKENKGISENTNAAMKLAAGEYILLCDHDDVLTPDALFHIAKAITEQKADVIYTDEDKVSMDANIILSRISSRTIICSVFARIIISVIFLHLREVFWNRPVRSGRSMMEHRILT